MKRVIKILLVIVVVLFGYVYLTNINNSQIKETVNHQDYHFKNAKLLNEHYNKHGIEMGFVSADAYELSASDVVNNPSSLHKLEKEDSDDVYYLEETNEFVIVSKEGYIRTYFYPDAGKAYFDKQ